MYNTINPDTELSESLVRRKHWKSGAIHRRKKVIQGPRRTDSEFYFKKRVKLQTRATKSSIIRQTRMVEKLYGKQQAKRFRNRMTKAYGIK